MQGNPSKNAVNNNKAWKDDKVAPEESVTMKKEFQCFECSGFGHVQKECPNYLKKKMQAFTSCWSEDDSDGDDGEATANHVAFTSLKSAAQNDVAEDVPEDVSEVDTTERLEILEEKWTELLKVNKKNILDKNSLISEKERLKKELDGAHLRLKNAEEIQENQNAELKQFKELFKLLRNSGSEALDEMLASGRAFKDHTGIGYSLPSSMNEGKTVSNPMFVKSTGMESLNTKGKEVEVQVQKSERKNLSDVIDNVVTSDKTSHDEGPSANRKAKPHSVYHSQRYNKVSSHQSRKVN
jgi:hypothetical protein